MAQNPTNKSAIKQGEGSVEENVRITEPKPAEAPATTTPKVYHSIDEVPAENRSAVKAAMNRVGIDGNYILNRDGDLDLTCEKLWFIQMLYRCGCFK